MTERPPWVVLVPGSRESVEQRVRAYFDELDPPEPMYRLGTCAGGYVAIYGTREIDIGVEDQLGEELSAGTGRPVYAIDLGAKEPVVLRFRQRQCVVENRDPDALARSLGCPLPRLPEAEPTQVTRSAALIEGLRAADVRTTLEKSARKPLRGDLHFDDGPAGVLFWSDTGDIGMVDETLSKRFPDATVYSIVASGDLAGFAADVLRAGACIGRYDIEPPQESDTPVLDNIKGERSPRRILEVLGIPVKLFQTRV